VNIGSGGAGKSGMPVGAAVCTHDVGNAVSSKTTLWTLAPDGYENVTTPPAAMLTVVSLWLVPDPS
jgi:hypothetical protein